MWWGGWAYNNTPTRLSQILNATFLKIPFFRVSSQIVWTMRSRLTRAPHCLHDIISEDIPRGFKDSPSWGGVQGPGSGGCGRMGA